MSDSTLVAGIATTNCTKGKHGWQVRSSIDLPDSRCLVVRTFKQADNLMTVASVYTKSENGVLTSVSGNGHFVDFNRLLACQVVIRVTKDVADTFHALQLRDHLQQLLVDIHIYYIRQQALRAGADHV